MGVKTAFIIGSGNAAWHFGTALQNIGVEILGVYNRSKEYGEKLAETLKIPFYSTLNAIPLDADIYIISVVDSAIATVSNLLPQTKGIVAHNSGSVSVNEISNKHLRRGVFYCLQTINKLLPMDFKTSPILVQANSSKDEEILLNLAKKLSDNVHKTSDLERTKLHIAAVFSCNFVNYLYAIAYEFSKENNIDFNLLIPLIQKTTAQITGAKDPYLNLTGPAIRKDFVTIEKHLTLLKTDAKKYNLYKNLTNNILNHKIDNNEEL